MSVDFDKLREIFLAALDRPAEQRDAHLDQACAGDEELRRNVAVMLKANAAGDGPLDRAALRDDRTGAYQTAPESPGMVVAGKYKLLEAVGEGGMGTVWMAQQTEPVKRLVAVKLLKPGMDSKQVLARFEQERQALALMDHPNIARVLDAGTTGEPGCVGAGRPFFAMDLVKGVPITRYCDEHRLTPRQRLQLFVPVCQATQHAHQKSIIHRDLKPSNVLVALYDGKPVPKVIDFGVAKATGQQLTEQTLHTGFGAVVGTLEYMSPEQASFNQLDVDTRSDVYALGVLLYELLTGSPPFGRKELEQGGVLEMLRVIREQEPTRPSTKLSTAEGLPALAASRGMEPARLTRLVRGELDWIVMKALEKDRERRYETANGLAMDLQRYLADEPVQACPPSAGYRFRKFMRRNKTALAVAGLILFCIALLAGGGGWVVLDRLARQTKAGNELELAMDQSELFQEQGKRAEALAAFNQAQMLAADFPPNPVRSARLAALKERLAAAGRDENFRDRFEDIRLRVRSQVNLERSSFPADATFRAIREALGHYGIEVGVMAPAQAAALVQGRPEPVRRDLIAALDECLNLAPSGEAKTRQWLLAALAAAEEDPWRRRVRKAMFDRAWKSLEQLAGKAKVWKQPPSFLLIVAESLPPSMRATRLELLRRTQRAYLADLWTNHHLAYALMKSGHPAEAIRYYTAALALRPESPGIYLNRAKALCDTGEFAAAIADYRRCVVLAPRYVAAHSSLGDALRQIGQLDEAIAECREAIRLKKDDFGGHYNLALALRDKKQWDDAIGEYRKAIALNPRYAPAHYALGLALQLKGQLDQAITEFRTASDIDPKYGQAHYWLGYALHNKKQWDEAIAEFRTVIALNAKDASAHIALGIALQDKGRLDEAITEYRQAINLAPKYAPPHYNLGRALRDKGRLDEAIVEYRKAIALDPKNAKAHISLGIALADKKQWDDAIAAFRTALKIDPKHALAHSSLGCALHNKRQWDEAIAEFRAAIALDPKYAPAHYNLGLVLQDKRQWDEAIAEFRTAVALDPKYAPAHYILGLALQLKGLLDEAIREYRQAIDLDPNYAEAHCNLGHTLRRQGRFKEALAALRRGHRLGSARPHWRYPSARWVAQAERFLALEQKLPELIKGEKKPADLNEQLVLADMCLRSKKLFAAAARFYAGALDAQPALARNLNRGLRYIAACAAALAGCGQGADADQLDDQERTRWRRQALDWLRADLDLWRKRLADGTPADRQATRIMLQHWQLDTELAGVRDAAALKKRPAEEHQAWRQLWADVAELLRKAGDAK
jgi:tetratricopeptide (TPR) repeat protein